MHSSQHIEPMRTKTKFREGASPVAKRALRPKIEEERYDEENDVVDTIPFWGAEEQSV